MEMTVNKFGQQIIAAAKEGAAIANGRTISGHIHIPAAGELRCGITLDADSNGTWLVTCPALPEVTTFGRDQTEARSRAVAAIDEALTARRANGEAAP